MGVVVPFRDVVDEVKGRWACYRDDWTDGWRCGVRCIVTKITAISFQRSAKGILAPSVYIFFASALPALAFGQQLAERTNGRLTVVQVLASTAISGFIQAVFGGQPLLIVGVAEPIVIIYSFMYQFLETRPEGEAPEFVAWCAWVCVWTSVMLVLLALFNTGKYVTWITRMSGELFGFLIAILFLQQAVKGTISEFRVPKLTDVDYAPDVVWFGNGTWAVIIGFGLLYTSMLLHSARMWTLFLQAGRSFLADYGAPIMVVVWSAAGYIASDALPGGKPRQVQTPNTWDATDSWSVAGRMGDVGVEYVFMALIPALIITCLFWFDHGVSSLLAQQARFGLERPPAFSWDLLLLAAVTLLLGLIGLPPINGVLPQAPMHTHTLVTLREEVVAAKAKKLAEREQREREEQKDGPKMRHSKSVSQKLAGLLRIGGGAGRGGRGEVGLGGGSGGGTPQSGVHLPHVATSPTLHSPGPSETQPHSVAIEMHPLKSAHLAGEPHGDNTTGSANGTGRANGANGANGSGAANGTGAANAGSAANGANGARSASEGEGAAGAAAAGEESRSTAAPSVAPTDAIEGVVEVCKAQENRLSNLIQSLLCAVMLALTPLIKLIPTSVLWGYFAYMALASLPGNDLWERVVLMFSDPAEWKAYLQSGGPADQAIGAATLTAGFVAVYTAIQFGTLIGIMALVTWAGITGVIFPIPILAIVPLRTFLLPRILPARYAAQLETLDPKGV
ncbi:hypothetical protein FOA52_004068 [Chlamydomonas sp. UWO 241]|nr:hypothetical protein FOA52_004068 [Chlamydomonas sp. UWO 241]